MKRLTKSIIDLTQLDIFDGIPTIRMKLDGRDCSPLLAGLYVMAILIMVASPYDFLSYRILAILGFMVPAYKTYSALKYKGFLFISTQ